MICARLKFKRCIALNRYVSAEIPKKQAETVPLQTVDYVHARRLVRLALEQKRLIGTSLVALGLSSIGTLAFPLALGKIVDMLEVGNHTGMDQYIYMLIFVFTLASAASFTRIITQEIANERIIQSLRAKLFSAIIHQPMHFFDATSTGSLLTRISTDTTVMSETVVEDLANTLKRVIEGLGGLAMLLYLSPGLTSLIMLTAPPLGLSAVYFGRKLKVLARRRLDAIALGTAFAEQRINAIKTVKLFAQEETENASFREIVHQIYLVGKSRAIYSVINMAVTGVLYSGGLLVIDNTLTAGQLTSFMIYSWFVLFSFMAVSSFWAQFNKALGASQRVFELLDMAPEEQTVETPDGLELTGNIEFRNVGFIYPERQATVLLNFTFTVEAGTTVALVGHSGSGKSSVVALITKLYPFNYGEILIDGKDISAYNAKWLRSRISLVPQEIALFSGTIADNIRYGLSGATDEDVIEAARLANAHHFIDAFPEKYKTQVGEGRIQLSGGQKQRIAIARALISKPRILILDEATSSLDSESEYLIHSALEKLSGTRTIIIISHRLSTVKLADSIALIKDGRVAEKGTFDELMQKEDGIFKSFVMLQQYYGVGNLSGSTKKE